MNLADYLTDTPWKAKAACRGMNSDPFFPSRPGGNKTTREARKVCSGCTVTQECLDYALTFSAHYDFGIFAGTNAEQRRLMRRERAA